MWDLSSPIRDQTCIPCIGRWTLNHQKVPKIRKLLIKAVSILDGILICLTFLCSSCSLLCLDFGEVCAQSLSHVRFFATPWTVAPDSFGPWVILARILGWVLYHWATWEALGAVYNSLNNNTVSHLPLQVPVFNEDCLNLLMKHNTAGQVEGTYCHFCDSKQLEHHDKVLLPSSQEVAVARLEGTS